MDGGLIILADVTSKMTPEQYRVYQKKRRERKKQGFWFQSGQATLPEFRGSSE